MTYVWHHVVYQQAIRKAGGDLDDFYDARNLLRIEDEAHQHHHKRSRVIPLSMLPDSAFEFAAELLGPGKAYNDLRRHYAGEDARLDALLVANGAVEE